MPEISVIIPTHNRAPLLKEHLNALAAQTYPRQATEWIVRRRQERRRDTRRWGDAKPIAARVKAHAETGRRVASGAIFGLIAAVTFGGSLISLDQAKKNLAAEIPPGTSFDQVKKLD